jgi:hypothetical protein
MISRTFTDPLAMPSAAKVTLAIPSPSCHRPPLANSISQFSNHICSCFRLLCDYTYYDAASGAIERRVVEAMVCYVYDADRFALQRVDYSLHAG